jgi:hypothetical protein
MVRVLTTFDPSTSKKEKTFITTRTRNLFEAALGAAHTDYLVAQLLSRKPDLHRQNFRILNFAPHLD